MDKVVCPNYIKKQPSFWDLKEAKEGIKFFNTTAIGFHVAVALNLGLRLGEVCGLKECDIDYNKKVLNIARAVQRNRKVKTIVKIPKTETSIRTLPLPDDMIKLFKARSKWIKLNMLQFGAAYSHEWDGFFSVDELGVILHDQSVGSRYRRLIKKSDLRKITFHDLRHSCASLLLDSGVDMKTIQEILGHADFSTTANIYSHVTNSKKLDALNNINIM
jgi:integrase